MQVGGVRRQQGGGFGPQRFDPVRRQLPIMHGKTERFAFDPGAGIGGQASLDGGVQGIEPDAAGRRSGGNEALPGQFQFQSGGAAIAQPRQTDHADEIVESATADHADRDSWGRRQPGQYFAQRGVQYRQAGMRDQRGQCAVVIENQDQAQALAVSGAQLFQDVLAGGEHQAASGVDEAGSGSAVRASRKSAAQR